MDCLKSRRFAGKGSSQGKFPTEKKLRWISGCLFQSWRRTSFSVLREQLMDRCQFYKQTKDRRIRSSSRYYQRLLRNFFSFLVPPSLRVLELGCGAGDLLAGVNPTRGLGVDFSVPLIEEAKRRHGQLEFQLAEAAEVQGQE